MGTQATWIRPSVVPAQCGFRVRYILGPARGRQPPMTERMTELPAMAEAPYTIVIFTSALRLKDGYNKSRLKELGWNKVS